MEMHKLEDIDLYTLKTADKNEANDLSLALLDLGIEYCFNNAHGTYQFVLDPPNFELLTLKFEEGIVEALQDMEAFGDMPDVQD